MLVPEPPPPKPVKITIEMKSQEVTCPFCLYTANMTQFFIKLKGGKPSEKRFKCPDCGLIMRKKTLVVEMSVEEFAEWTFMMQQWDRIDFEKFRRRLKEMGISYQFWAAYKKAKETYTSESYEDHLMQQQTEEHEKYKRDHESQRNT